MDIVAFSEAATPKSALKIACHSPVLVNKLAKHFCCLDSLRN